MLKNSPEPLLAATAQLRITAANRAVTKGSGSSEEFFSSLFQPAAGFSRRLEFLHFRGRLF
jgi:hypothetical protein